MNANEENLLALELLARTWARESALERLAEEALTSWQLAKKEGC